MAKQQQLSFDDLLSQQAVAEKDKLQNMLKKTSSEQGRKPVLPGFYIMKVGCFAWKDKKDDSMRISPEITVSRNNALLLNISLQVADEGTEVVPTGSSIFHTITLLPAKDADEKKIENTLRFMKPQLSALLGHDLISITSEWLKENCLAEFKSENGKYVCTREHKMVKWVAVNIEEVENKITHKPKIGVVKIDKPRPGDKSVTYKYTNTMTSDGPEYANKVLSDVPDSINISPKEEVKKMDTSKITSAKTTETEF